jgi:hypothetical protein
MVTIFISIWWIILAKINLLDFHLFIIFTLSYGATALFTILLSLNSRELNMLSTLLPGKFLKHYLAVKNRTLF